MTVGFGSAPYVQMLPQGSPGKFAEVSLMAPNHFRDPVAGADFLGFVPA